MDNPLKRPGLTKRFIQAAQKPRSWTHIVRTGFHSDNRVGGHRSRQTPFQQKFADKCGKIDFTTNGQTAQIRKKRCHLEFRHTTERPAFSVILREFGGFVVKNVGSSNHFSVAHPLSVVLSRPQMTTIVSPRKRHPAF